MKNLYKLCISFLSLLICSCQSKPMPNIVPGIEVKRASSHILGTIGEVEPLYILPMKSPFYARIDTGAETSSIDVTGVKSFERDGENWVSFFITNKETGEVKKFEKPVSRTSSIKRIENSEKRTVVQMEIKMGTQIFTEDFSLANREKFEYQVLIGRNVLSGRAIVDPSISNTLH